MVVHIDRLVLDGIGANEKDVGQVLRAAIAAELEAQLRRQPGLLARDALLGSVRTLRRLRGGEIAFTGSIDALGRAAARSLAGSIVPLFGQGGGHARPPAPRATRSTPEVARG